MYHRPTINHLFLQKHVIKILTTSMMNMIVMKIYLQILCIPPMQTIPKDVANICHKQMSEEKELWTLSPMKRNHVGATLEKSLHHSRKPKQKRLFLNMSPFEGVEIEEVDYVPIDVNGTHIYRINCLENEWIGCQKNHQCRNMHMSIRKGF